MPAENKPPKVVIVGPQKSGKSKLSERFQKNTYDEKYKPTIAVDYDDRVTAEKKLQLWDASGDFKYSTLVSMYFNKAAVILITCDLTDKNGLEKTKEWLTKVKDNINTPKDVVLMFVATKTDDKDNQEIKNEDFQKFAQDNNCPHFFTSAKTGEGIQKMFADIKQTGKKVNPEIVVDESSQPQLSKLSRDELIDQTHSALKEACERLEENLKDFIRDKVVVTKGQNQDADTLMSGYLEIDKNANFTDKNAHEKLFKPADQKDAVAVKQQYELLMKIKAKSFDGDSTLEAKVEILHDFAERFSKELNDGKLEDVLKTPDSKSANGWIALKVLVSIIGGIIIPAVAFAVHAYATTGSANFFKGKHERLRENLSAKVEQVQNIPKNK